MWPIMPFTVEECWNYYSKGRPFYEQAIKTLPEMWRNPEYDECIALTQKLQRLLEATIDKDLMWRWNVTIDANDRQIGELVVC